LEQLTNMRRKHSRDRISETVYVYGIQDLNSSADLEMLLRSWYCCNVSFTYGKSF